jgi:hypothetical protein
MESLISEIVMTIITWEVIKFLVIKIWYKFII